MTPGGPKTSHARPVAVSVCPSPEALASLAAGQASPDGSNLAVQEHVAACAACQDALSEMRENDRFLDCFRRGIAAAGSPGAEAPALTAPASDEPLGAEPLPGYRIEDELYRGGQGIVYRAVQLDTKRTVAIKMMLRGGYSTPRQRHRFEREAEIAAALRHPNIVTIFHSGPAQGRPGRYAIAMEYIDGTPLDQWALALSNRSDVSQARRVRASLVIMSRICEAVQYAHGRGVIHRDLKPGNILVEQAWEADGLLPDPAEAVPRILDFGLARRTSADGAIDSTLRTQTGEFAGTLAYASPEQVSGNQDRIDVRTDVYALGVVLFELLLGRSPYPVDGSIAQTVAHITGTDAEHLADDRPLGDEVWTILRKALAKQPDRRYQTAAALRADIEHYLADEPIDAKRDSTWYLLRKAASRHRWTVGGATLALLLLAGFAAGMTWQAKNLTLQRAQLEASLRDSAIERGRLMALAGSTAQAEQMLWPKFAEAIADRPDFDPASGGATLTGSSLHAWWALVDLYARQPCIGTMRTDPSSAVVLNFSTDDTALLCLTRSGQASAWAIPSGPLLNRTTLESPLDGQWNMVLADGQSVLISGERGVSRLSLRTGAMEPCPGLNLSGVRALRADPAGNWLVGITDQSRLRLWDARTFEQLPAETAVAPYSQLCPVDSRRIAAIDQQGNPALFDSGTLAKIQDLPRPEPVGVSAQDALSSGRIVASPDGRWLAIGYYLRTVVWPMDHAGDPIVLVGHSGKVGAITFSADSRTVLTCSQDKTARLWSLPDGRQVSKYIGQAAMVAGAISHDNRVIATADLMGVVKLWESAVGAWRQRVWQSDSTVDSAVFSPDGNVIAASGGSGMLGLWDARTHARIVTMPGLENTVSMVAFSPGNDVLASCGFDSTVRTWNARNGQPIAVFRGHTQLLSALAASPNGKWLASGGYDQFVAIWPVDGDGAEPLVRLSGHTARVISLAFSPNSRWLADAGADHTCRIWDTRSWTLHRTLVDHAGPIRAVCYSPDGRLLATAADDLDIRVYDAETLEPRAVLRGCKQDVFSLAFAPGQAAHLLASADRSGVVMLWDADAARQLAAFEEYGGGAPTHSVAFSPDGRSLIFTGTDGDINVLRLDYYTTHLGRHWRVLKASGG